MGATYMECSSKEKIGVQEIFNRAITIAVGDEYKHSGGKGNLGFGGTTTTKRKKNRSCRIL